MHRCTHSFSRILGFGVGTGVGNGSGSVGGVGVGGVGLGLGGVGRCEFGLLGARVVFFRVVCCTFVHRDSRVVCVAPCCGSSSFAVRILKKRKLLLLLLQLHTRAHKSTAVRLWLVLLAFGGWQAPPPSPAEATEEGKGGRGKGQGQGARESGEA